jgi:uncharacterized protein YkwD
MQRILGQAAGLTMNDDLKKKLLFTFAGCLLLFGVFRSYQLEPNQRPLPPSPLSLLTRSQSDGIDLKSSTTQIKDGVPSAPVPPLSRILEELNTTSASERPAGKQANVQILEFDQRALLKEINYKRRQSHQNTIELNPSISEAAAKYLALHLKQGYNQINTRQLYFLCYEAGATVPPGSVSMHPNKDGSYEFAPIFERLGELEATHLGIAAARDPKSGVDWVLLVFADQGARLDRFDRYLIAPKDVTISGNLRANLQDPQIWVTSPNSHTVHVDTDVISGKFVGKVRFLEGLGEYQIEVMAKGRLGPKIAALFPINVGKKAVMPGAEQETPLDFGTLREGEQFLLEALNQDRIRLGLLPLTLDDKLSDIARKHSEDMAGNGFVAHVSPTTNEDHGQRLKDAGIEFIIAGENIAAASSDIRKIQPGLMSSPGHRSNIVNSGFSQVGIGLAAKDTNGFKQYFATQLFINPIKTIKPREFSDYVFNSLNKVAREHSDPGYSWSASLSYIAEQEARKLAHSDPEVMDGYVIADLLPKVKAAGIRGDKLVYQKFRVRGGQDLFFEYQVPSKTFNQVGIGAFQGNSRYTGDKTVWGVIIFLNH